MEFPAVLGDVTRWPSRNDGNHENDEDKADSHEQEG